MRAPGRCRAPERGRGGAARAPGRCAPGARVGGDWSAAGLRGSGAWGRVSATGLLREGRHDEHRPVARELALRLLAERDGGAHLRLLHHHRLQRPERPGAAARLPDHAVSAAGRGCRGGVGWGVCAGPDLSPALPAGSTVGHTWPGGLGTPSPARSTPEWPGSALRFLPVLHVPHPGWPMSEQHTSTPTPVLPPGAFPPASTRGVAGVTPCQPEAEAA